MIRIINNSRSLKIGLDKIIVILLCIVSVCVMSINVVEHKSTLVFYWFLILTTVLLSIICKKNIISIGSIFLILLLAFPMAFGYDMAMDAKSYDRIFHIVSSNGWNFWNIGIAKGIEYGYLFLNKIISFITDDFYICQIVMVSMSSIILVLVIQLFRDRIDRTYFILFFFLDLYFKFMAAGLYRMYIALSITMISYYFLLKKNLKGYVISILIASVFHISALFMFIFIGTFSNRLIRKVRNWKVFYAVVILVAVLVLRTGINVLVLVLGGRYLGYVAAYEISFGLSTIIKLIAILLMLYVRKYIVEDISFYDNCLIIAWAGWLIDIFLSINALGRIVYYTDIAMLLLVSFFINSKAKYQNKIIYYVFFTIYYIFVFSITINSSERQFNSLFPYITKMFQLS